MSTTTDTGPGTVWIRDDHCLVVTVPYDSIEGQSEDVIRRRLMKGLLERWPKRHPTEIEHFTRAVARADLTMMAPEEEGQEMGYGVVLR